jgi:pimeloyl-ACP methyl ester carboxylesterase
VVVTGDGHRLAVEVTGAPDGLPVFLMHGTPGSRRGIKPRGIVLYRQGIRLICYDRPGYGGSDRREGRRVVDAADDVRAIADALEVDRFAVVGRSGGGPHALAAAAMLPDRVDQALVQCCIAPPDADGLDWYGGMTPSNVQEYVLADTNPERLRANLIGRAERMRRDPGSQLVFPSDELIPADRRVIGNIEMRRKITGSYTEGLRLGVAGWFDDSLAFRRDWGFDPKVIGIPVQLWHGAEDQFAPVEHTRWLARRIPDARANVQPGAGHFTAVERLPEMLAALTAAGPR